jgi:hypothetical protein
MTAWLLRRLREPSTWRGIVWLLTALGVTLDPMAWEYIMTIGMAVAGLLGVLLSESPHVPNPPVLPPPSLPPIELVGRPAAAGTEADEAGDRPGADAARRGRRGYDDRLRADVLTQPNFGVRPPIDRPLDDHFLGGWGDR